MSRNAMRIVVFLPAPFGLKISVDLAVAPPECYIADLAFRLQAEPA